MPTVDSKRFKDAKFAAEYFSGEDANSAQKKLSEDGATINIMEVVIALSKEVQTLSGAGTPEGDKQQLESEDTPASQKEALKLGISAQENAQKEQERQQAEKEKEQQNKENLERTGVITGDSPDSGTSQTAPNNSPATSPEKEKKQEVSGLSSGITL